MAESPSTFVLAGDIASNRLFKTVLILFMTFRNIVCLNGFCYISQTFLECRLGPPEIENIAQEPGFSVPGVLKEIKMK